MAELTVMRLDPEPVLVALAGQQLTDLGRRKHARRFPVSAVDAPEMLVAALGRAPVGQGHAPDRLAALRKNAGHDRGPAIDRGQRHADLELAHGFPARQRANPGIERLRLAHRGSGRQHHHVASLQARGHAVEVDEAGRHPGDIVRVVGHLGHAIEQIDHQRVHRLEALLHAGALLADVEHLLFSLVEDLGDLGALGVEGPGRDVVADLDQLAQDRALAHDLGVAADIGRARHILGQLVQVGQAADLVGLALAFELLEYRDHVGRLVGVDQLGDRTVDQLVLEAVVVRVLQQIADAVPGTVVKQQAAEHAGLGLDRVRRHAQLGDLSVLGGRRQECIVGRKNV